jgi:hypothetical protein
MIANNQQSYYDEAVQGQDGIEVENEYNMNEGEMFE